jgi:Uma2 family endonuclease
MGCVMTVMTAAPPVELFLRSVNADWTRARWESLLEDGNRYEVIDGVLYLSTAPSAFHQWIHRQIFLQLLRQFEEPGAGLVLYAPIGLFMPDVEAVQPDLLVIRAEDRGMIRDRRIYGVPALLVEILSPSNAAYDLETKRKTYARAGVPEYWAFRPATRDALVFSDPDPVTHDYRSVVTVPAEGELVSPTLPVRFPIAVVFAGAPDTTI